MESKKIFGIFASFILFSGLVTAGSGLPYDGQCSDNGFDFGVARYFWVGDNITSAKTTNPLYTVNLWGGESSVNWTANPAVAGIIQITQDGTSILSGGTQGQIIVLPPVIIHDGLNPDPEPVELIFCGNTTQDVPEFSSVLIPLFVLILAPAFAFIAIKKKD